MWDTGPRETKARQAACALRGDNLPAPRRGVRADPYKCWKRPKENANANGQRRGDFCVWERRKLRKTGHFQIHLEDGSDGGKGTPGHKAQQGAKAQEAEKSRRSGEQGEQSGTWRCGRGEAGRQTDGAWTPPGGARSIDYEVGDLKLILGFSYKSLFFRLVHY